MPKSTDVPDHPPHIALNIETGSQRRGLVVKIVPEQPRPQLRRDRAGGHMT